MVERGGKLPPGWRRVMDGLYQHDGPFMMVRKRGQGDWWISASLRSPDGTVRSWHSYGYATARQAMVAGCGLLPAAERGRGEAA